MLIDHIRNSQNRDETATLLLLEKFRPLLKKYAHKLSYEDAFDDLQADFLALIQNLRLNEIHIHEDGGMVSYIATSVRSSYIKHIAQLKKNQNTLTFSDLSEGGQAYIQAELAETDTYSDIEFHSICALLTATEMKVIRSIYHSGYSVSETAVLCGISRQAVNQTRRRAIQKLQKLISTNI